MTTVQTKYRFLFAGGGTGGHLYPAIAVADEIRKLKPESEILFVGTKSKIEGKVVPQLGYKFKSIWIKGFARKFNLSNILFPVRLIVSLIQSIIISMKFKPAVAIGSGGYVAGPAIWAASVMGAKILLMEQNSYPGVTTRILEKYSDEVHVSFESSKKYLRKKDKIVLSGNPIRSNLGTLSKAEAVKLFELSESKKILLVLGGSLGARTINESIKSNIDDLRKMNIQVLWQTGKNNFEYYKNLNSDTIKVLSFIENMNAAYSACDIVIARAGATTLAELSALGIASILVPSPNVAENHQYHNAKSLVEANAAVLIEDKYFQKDFLNVLSDLIFAKEKLNDLKKNIKSLAKPEAANTIAKRAINLVLAS